MSGRRTTALSVVIVAVLVGTLFAFAQWRRETRLESGEGTLRDAFLVQSEPLTYMSVETIYFSGEDSDETVYRVTTWDAKSGKRLARVKEVEWRHCAAASKGLAWCHTNKDELEVLNVPSLTLKHAAAQVNAKVVQKIMNATQLDVTPEGRARVTLADGRKVDLDAETLSITPQSTADRPSSPGPRIEPCSIPNSERQGLCARDDFGKVKRLDEGDGWLRLAVVSEVPGGWILAANTSLDDAVNQRRVIRVDEQLKEVGATSLGKVPGWSTVSTMWVTKDELFLVPVRENGITIGISAKTGQEAFRIQH